MQGIFLSRILLSYIKSHDASQLTYAVTAPSTQH
jgi:hypothetical protein